MLTHFRTLSGALMLSCCLLAAHPVQSETITHKLPNDTVATAQWLAGDEDKKVILLLHGFLQTRDFFTVRRLGEALNEMGYNVLLPTLTLGIANRQQSLACEAIHMHSLEQDVEEIGNWVDWLHQHTDKKVALIGHSVGSLELLAYLANEPDPPVSQAILISLIAFAQGPIAKENETERQQALLQLANDGNELSNYRLAFCDRYTTTPANYLSYMAWNGNKTLENLNNLNIAPTIVLGGEDRRLGEDWLPSLRQTNAEVVQIDGANHFFDREYEFDLMDSVIELLER
jgi:pimeloyl-ACP methyl ester carboxylesterase